MGARRKSAIAKTWLQERKEILQKIKDQVRLYLGEETRDIALYAQAYKNDIARPWQPSSMAALHTRLLQAQVAFGGDFHPYAQAQRAHLRVLRSIVGERPLILALECFFIKHQRWLNQFLKGELQEAEFLKKIGWENNWGFPWEYYRPLVRFAIDHNLPVLAVNEAAGPRSGESLHRRDQRAAQILCEAAKEHPEALIYCLYGDLHIAEKHLPFQFYSQYQGGPRPEVVSVYLNSESIYFELAEQGLENQLDVVSFNENQYCLLSSPPWVKWQSYLMYLEENFDVDLDDEDDEVGTTVDYTDHVSDLARMISSAIDEDLRTDAIEVYSMKDSQVPRRVQKLLPKGLYEIAHRLVRNDQGFYLPETGFFYLSKATVNHAASLAGQYVHAQLCRRRQVLWSFPKDFVRCIWVEAMAFLLSKFVNPKRKAQTMGDLKKQLQAFDREDEGREPLLLALDQKMSELLEVYAGRQKAKTFVPGEKSSYIHAARFIGEMLGERYFILFQNRTFSLQDLKELLKVRLEDKSFDAFYYGQLKLLDQLEAEGKGGNEPMVSE